MTLIRDAMLTAMAQRDTAREELRAAKETIEQLTSERDEWRRLALDATGLALLASTELRNRIDTGDGT